MARAKKPTGPAAIIAAIIIAVLSYFGVNLNQGTGTKPTSTSSTSTSTSSTSSTPNREPDPASLPKTAGTFTTAKKWLYDKVYKDVKDRKSLYCGCTYNEDLSVDLASCGLQALQAIPRAQRVEAEHIFPAAQFGNYRQCWREPEKFEQCRKSNGKIATGRECCEDVDPVFKAAHNDLMNLYPAVGEVNGQRKDYNWGMIEGEKREFGKCNFEVDSSIRRAEPPEKVQGDIARTMFYMEDTYGFTLSDQDRQLFTAWSKQDPVDAWEKERNQRIKAIQGRGNRFIEP